MSRASDRGIQKTKQDIGSAVGDGVQGLKKVGGNILHTVQQLGSDAATAVKDRYEDIRDDAADYVRQGRKTASRWEKGLEKQIQNKPLYSLMLALGAVLAIGYLCRRS